MGRALLYCLAQTWATDPHHHPRSLAQARKKGTPTMNHIRRAVALTAAGAMVTVTASACGGAPTATGPPTNGLEKESPAAVLRAAAAAFRAAKSVAAISRLRSAAQLASAHGSVALISRCERDLAERDARPIA